MNLEICRLVCDIRISCGVGLIKTVARKLFHQVEDLGGNRFLYTSFSCTLNKNSALALHLFDILFTHCAAQQICTAQ